MEIAPTERELKSPSSPKDLNSMQGDLQQHNDLEEPKSIHDDPQPASFSCGEDNYGESKPDIPTHHVPNEPYIHEKEVEKIEYWPMISKTRCPSMGCLVLEKNTEKNIKTKQMKEAGNKKLQRILKFVNNVLNNEKVKKLLVLSGCILQYVDYGSSVYSIVDFFINGKTAFGAISAFLLILNMIIRSIYHYFDRKVIKDKKMFKELKRKEKVELFCLSILNIILGADYIDFEVSKFWANGFEKIPRRSPFILHKLGTDSIPLGIMMLYSQVLDNKVSISLMISSASSIFSLARGAYMFTFNPMKFYRILHSQTTKHKFEGIEILFELFDTFIELLSRFGLLVAFAYVARPWGWVYYLCIVSFLFFIYCLGHAGDKSIPWFRHFLSSIFLVSIYIKGEIFYHPFTRKYFDKKNGSWNADILVWDSLKHNLIWRITQMITIAAPLGITISKYDELNTFAFILFWIGVGSLAYSVLINYCTDLLFLGFVQRKAIKDVSKIVPNFEFMICDEFDFFKKQFTCYQYNRMIKYASFTSKLSFHFDENIIDTHYQNILNNVFQFKNLEQLEFSITPDEHRDLRLEILSKHLRTSNLNSSLKSLKLYLNYCRSSKYETILALMSSLKNYKLLTHFELGLKDSNEFDNEILAKIEDLFKDSSLIKHLKLTLEGNPGLSDERFENLIKIIESKTSLNILHLNLNDCENLETKYINTLAEYLRRNTCLNQLGLDLSYNSKRSDEFGAFEEQTFKALLDLSDSLNHLTSLDQLYICFKNLYHRSDDFHINLVGQICNLTQLKKLDLRIQSNSFQDIQLLMIISQITKLELLEELTLDLFPGRIEDRSGDILNGLKEMKSLSCLKIKLWTESKEVHNNVSNSFEGLSKSKNFRFEFLQRY